jgi:hypothetical protein
MIKHLIVFSVYTFSTPAVVLAGIQDIRHMSQNSNRYFNVTCLNGSSETVDAQAIAENLVCKMGGSVSSQRSSVVCTGNEFQNWFYVTRVSDGKQFGDFGEKLSLNVCQQAVRASSSGVVCTGNEFQNWFYLTRIPDGQKFGGRLSLETCLQLSNSKK